ncbi:AMP-binding protein [Microvirga mediterraneensis]|uniref:Long-chain-fatty-acid--CoA ligase n=1 Tax=Microvirga mediterraneensis TaxID=2754695 RepID=A0A838BTM9_9HYPH|nr:AMP-binding protein [Microvirga mediterraneensis]MBA1158412.1 AMP-binding protein [Microvirga mediterraneensis]
MTVSTPAPATAGATDPYAARPWLASYPAQVPKTIDEAGIGTLNDIFRQAVASYPNRAAVESFGTRMTYASLGREADAVASWLQSQGLKKGDRVAIMLPNVMAFPTILFGVLLAGGTVVNVNPLYTPRELTYQLKDSGARFLFVLENFAATVEESVPDLTLDRVILVTPGDLLGLKGAVVNLVSRHVKKAVKPFSLPQAIAFRTVIGQGGRQKPQPVNVSPDDVAFLQYTGGTTGIAKGATLLHRNVAANVLQCEAWMRPFFGDREDHLMVTALPLYHIFALTVCGMLMTRIGGCQLLIANPRDIPGFVKTLQKSRITLMSGLNTLYNALANAPGIEKVDFSQMVFSVSGGMATQEAVAKKWKQVTGQPIVEGYGLSETSPVVCANRLDIEEFTGTIGYPLPSTDVSVRSSDGTALPPGERGELCVKGPQVMAGYWQRPDETAKVMTADGWFRTGDVAVMLPDGQIKIVDRMKDMVLVSGFNVYPNEVEDVIVKHPGVMEAAVIGLPDEHSGETVVAYVVRRDQALTVEELREFCRENLTGYKVPRRIEFRETLPKTNVGKVLRRALKEEVEQGRS